MRNGPKFPTAIRLIWVTHCGLHSLGKKATQRGFCVACHFKLALKFGASVFNAIFETKVRDLWNLYVSTGDLEHQGEQGLFRELFVRRLLESLLPAQFGIGSGIVIDRWERQSPRADLIIYDRRLMPPILQSDGHGIYVVDSVLRVIEVKSTLRLKDLRQFGQMVTSLSPENGQGLKLAMRGNLEDGKAYYPFASLFAYRSSIAKVEQAAQSVPALHGKPERIHVVSPKSKCPSKEIDVSRVKKFCNLVLDQLEATSASRSKFSLSEWMR